MKFTVELSDEEIQKALDEAVAVKIAGMANVWASEWTRLHEIKAAVMAAGNRAIERLVDDAVTDLPAIKNQIADEMTAAIKRKLSAAMKAAEKEAGKLE